MSDPNRIEIPYDLVGNGSFGQIRTCMIDGEEKICKIIDFKDNNFSFINECMIMSSIKHPYINRICENYRPIIHRIKVDDVKYNRILLVQDRATGDLNKKKLSENEIYEVLFKILKAVELLHSYKIIHCDIKPGNILYYNSLTDLKLTDFSHSTFDTDFNYGIISTPGYTAPEVLRNENWEYGVDVWSIGCTIYELYYGNPIIPYQNYGKKYTLEDRKLCELMAFEYLINVKHSNTSRGKINPIYPHEKFTVKSNLDYLISKMLDFNVHNRIKISELLEMIDRNNIKINYTIIDIMKQNISDELIHLIAKKALTYYNETIAKENGITKKYFINVVLLLASKTASLYNTYNHEWIDGCILIILNIFSKKRNYRLINNDVELDILDSIGYKLIKIINCK